MRPARMKRRLLALALASLVLDPLALFAGLRAAGQACHDHVCLCARRCPPRRDPARSCHSSAPADSAVRATCSHERDAGLAAAVPALLPAEAPSVVTLALAHTPAARHECPSAGFRRIVSPPPKRT
jgi:hypothetical protein